MTKEDGLGICFRGRIDKTYLEWSKSREWEKESNGVTIITTLYWITLYDRHCFKCFISIRPFNYESQKVGAIIIPLTNEDLRLERLSFAQSYIAGKWQSWDLDHAGCLAPELLPFSHPHPSPLHWRHSQSENFFNHTKLLAVPQILSPFSLPLLLFSLSHTWASSFLCTCHLLCLERPLPSLCLAQFINLRWPSQAKLSTSFLAPQQSCAYL